METTMADNPLRQLNACGQSVWNDFIRRTFITNGDLQRLVSEDGISGVTSNPTIFEKAIDESSDYDHDLRRLIEEGKNAEQTFQHLASTDVRMAADVLRPIYDRTGGHDGFVSIEVSPDAAHDTAKSIDDAHILRRLVDRPNVMIKIPATPEGLPAIEQLIYEGINVNVTLIFAVEVYEQVMDAFLTGLERRAGESKPIDRIASVASFFVSRVDTLVDKLLEEKGKPELKELEGKAANANAKIAYERFERVFGSARFQRLAAKGAQVQRPLWASTSTKNPSYPDTLYVKPLVGAHTVNTMPMETIDAVRDHGEVECGAIKQGLDEAHRTIEALEQAGISMKAVTDQLTKEGVEKFSKSLHSLLQTIEEQRHSLVQA
jgi:transaldolase